MGRMDGSKQAWFSSLASVIAPSSFSRDPPEFFRQGRVAGFESSSPALQSCAAAHSIFSPPSLRKLPFSASKRGGMMGPDDPCKTN